MDMISQSWHITDKAMRSDDETREAISMQLGLEEQVGLLYAVQRVEIKKR